MAELEKAIEAYLVSEVRKNGGMAFKFTSPAHRGVPDRIVIFPNQLYFVECKTETGRPTALQIKTIKALQEMGMKVLVVHSRQDVDEFITAVVNS